jgi:tetrahydromethanopterin S-methyltransferase subunit G
VTRLQILLNRTREEYITKVDSSDQMNRVMNRLDGLDAKIDRLIERK